MAEPICIGGMRPDAMTAMERMMALMTGQKHDRPPFNLMSIGFSGRVVGLPLKAMYTEPQAALMAQLRAGEMFGCEPVTGIGYASYGAWEFGGEIRMPQSEWEGAPSIVRTPVQSDEDIEKLELPDVKTAGLLPIMMECSKLQDSMGMPVMCGASADPATLAANVVDAGRLCRLMIKKPKLAHRAMRLATDHLMQVWKYWAETFGGPKMTVVLFSPVAANQVISPQQFEEFVFPYQAELTEKARDLQLGSVTMHICGEQNLNLPIIKEMYLGTPEMPFVLSFGHEVDLEKAAKMFPDNILFGNVEPAVIQNGTPEEVYELTRITIEKGKKAPRGFILAPGCELPPMAPAYNVWTMRKALADFGFYD
jgi:uroporphyrinogen decarboxylase